MDRDEDTKKNLANIQPSYPHTWSITHIHDYGLIKIRKTIKLKGLGHTILGNFSTDRMVIELTKISK